MAKPVLKNRMPMTKKWLGMIEDAKLLLWHCLLQDLSEAYHGLSVSPMVSGMLLLALSDTTKTHND